MSAPISADRSLILQGLRLLVVDDDLDTVDLAAIILDSHGAETIKATSAAEALIHWQLHPHLLISDLAMPGQDGYWLLDQIKQQSPSVTEVLAIAWTACSVPQEKERALVAGYQQFLEKPVDPACLVAIVANLLGRPVRELHDANGEFSEEK
ncbi:MAG: response regulator [Oculatellaceae cyanobacterium Prado106]|nr:response regulator [Oculatellaceae cyanobacterium Prado106]